MKDYRSMTKEELLALQEQLQKEYKEFQDQGLKLDMSRGKPSEEQLDISMGMLDVLNADTDLMCDAGFDCRNYGVLQGINEARELLAQISEVPAENIIIYGNSSLNIMYDTIARSFTHGVMDTPRGASRTRLSSSVRCRVMTDILQLPSILVLR